MSDRDDVPLTTWYSGKLLLIDDADWVVLPCVCGHAKAAHEGHTHAVGTEPPSHCSQGCGCREYGPEKRKVQP
jgi:deoxyribodipyrimidine photolyase-like uncharacterized protein